MELQSLENYTERELLELIVSNQVRSEQRLFKIYAFLSKNKQFKEEFAKNYQSKAETMQDFLNSIDELDIEIKSTIS